jgi:hypothetical protein
MILDAEMHYTFVICKSVNGKVSLIGHAGCRAATQDRDRNQSYYVGLLTNINACSHATRLRLVQLTAVIERRQLKPREHAIIILQPHRVERLGAERNRAVKISAFGIRVDDLGRLREKPNHLSAKNCMT